MGKTKFLGTGIFILVMLLFASYLVPSFYLRGYADSRDQSNLGYFGSANINPTDSNYDGNNYYSNRFRRNIYGRGMMGGYGGMMGGYGGMMNGFGGMMGGNWGTGTNQYSNNALNEEDVSKDIEDSLKNATIDKEKNTVTYSGDSIKIVALGGPEEADEKFIIGGLINPIVYISKNSEVTLEFINEDEGMYHNIAIINSVPPYAYMSMMQGQIYPGSYTGMLPPAEEGEFYFDSTKFKAKYEGDFYYICQYPGHAAKGMYGKIIVK